MKNFFNRNFITSFSKKNFSQISWNHVKTRQSDPILGLVEEFKKDKDPRKVNLSAGTYKDDAGKPYILNCVKQAHKQVIEKGFDMEYLPIDGLPSFVDNTLKLAYGNNPLLKEGKIVGLQSLSGTGALKLGFEFLEGYYPHKKTIYIPNPSWPNHQNVINRSGLNFKEYSYYNESTKSLDFNGLLQDLDKAENHSIFLLHSCAHNPTGVDPTQSQWEEILRLIKKKKHFPFFDMAYQGFTSGDVDRDAFAVRLFAESGIEMALAQSFAKNFGLYGQRAGTFSLLTNDSTEASNAISQLKFIARAQYSSPPKYGAQIVDIILSNPDLTEEWKRELKVMAGRINDMRVSLHEKLILAGTRQNWDHIIKQIGMFAFTGLTKNQVESLKRNYHIYLTSDGRISISGLNTKNVEYVAQAFHNVTIHNTVIDKQNI